LKRHPSIVNEATLVWNEHNHTERFSCRRKALSADGRGEQIGCSMYEVQPGKTAFPFHFHWANEETIYILSGHGSLRLGEQEFAVAAGDYIALPTGPDHAHQLIGKGEQPLRYLCFSTMQSPEVCEYPDSDKVGALAGSAPGSKEGRKLTSFHRKSDNVPYFEGEDA